MTLDAATRHRVIRPPAWAYLWWLAVGALLSFGVLAGFTIGIPLFLLGVVLALGGAAIPATRTLAVTALPAGLAFPLLYVAWLNRDGPGTVCSSSGSFVSCEEQWNPWPWLAAAVVLVLLSVGMAGLVRIAPRRR